MFDVLSKLVAWLCEWWWSWVSRLPKKLGMVQIYKQLSWNPDSCPVCCSLIDSTWSLSFLVSLHIDFLSPSFLGSLSLFLSLSLKLSMRESHLLSLSENIAVMSRFAPCTCLDMFSLVLNFTHSCLVSLVKLDWNILKTFIRIAMNPGININGSHWWILLRQFRDFKKATSSGLCFLYDQYDQTPAKLITLTLVLNSKS